MICFVFPPKFCTRVVSSFPWDLQWSQEKTKTMLMQNFGGQRKSIMVFSEMANGNPTCGLLGLEPIGSVVFISPNLIGHYFPGPLILNLGNTVY